MSARYRRNGSCVVREVAAPRTRWKSAEIWAQAWLTESRSESTGPAESFIDEMTWHPSKGVVALLVALANTAANPEELTWVGAGPIEDLLSHNGHGARFIAQVEAAAIADTAFRTAVTHMWVGHRVEADVRARLVTLGARDLTRKDP